jgi:hypothetical protein
MAWKTQTFGGRSKQEWRQAVKNLRQEHPSAKI